MLPVTSRQSGGEQRGPMMVRIRNHVKVSLLLMTAQAVALGVPHARAQAANQMDYNLPKDSLGNSLRLISRLSGREIIFTAQAVEGKLSPSLKGHFSTDDAVKALLVGTDLIAEFRKDVILIRERSQTSELSERVPAAVAELIVTGSHIRGTEPVSQVITASRSQIEQRGRSDLGAFARDIPQNFSGGQNPGVVGAGAQGGNENLTSSSTLNLRGLGPDATLTLVNGHRVAYDGVSQGVDISAIPLAAIERMEIVADGASALYGSDAVAGVANIILRRSYEGLWTSARLGTTTEGGGTEQQYSAVTGASWNQGGLIATMDYRHSTAIRAGQRSFAHAVDNSATLVPRQRQVSAIISGHQDLGDMMVFELDAQYSSRRSALFLPNFADQNVFTNGIVSRPRVEMFTATPTLRLHLPYGWEASVSGTYGSSTSRVLGDTYLGGEHFSHRNVRYENETKTAEAFAEGPIATLAAGEVRLALGGGYRSISLKADSSQTIGSTVTPIQMLNRERNVAYGFGEVAIPLIGEANRLPFVQALLLTGALRYEKHYGVGDVTAPKIGIVYRPDKAVALRASWGKSFKAPTLYDQSRGFQAILLPAYFFGSSDGAPDASLLYLGGGNDGLKPERATTWTATLELKPRFVEGLTIEGSYFHIRYRNRVGSPMSSFFGALTNPTFSPFIQRSPSPAAIDAASSSALFGLENFTGSTYDPASVVAIVDNRLQNVASQSAEGLDLSLRYSADLSGDDRLSLSSSASYLKSDRKIVAGQAAIQKAGTIFNPPHWRAQAGSTWDHKNITLSAFGSYIGGTLDNRLPPYSRVRSFLAIDMVGQWRSTASSGALKGVEALFSAANLFDQAPSPIRSDSSADPGFDSTNYPATGRTISLTLSKAW